MTTRQFFNRLANSQVDVLQKLLDILTVNNIEYCLIGGLAVNAYSEPVVSLDLDILVTTDRLSRLKKAASQDFEIKEFPDSLNLKSPKSELRIQVQKDPRYQSLVERASTKTVLDYSLKVAAIEDVLSGKIWAYQDEQRRQSKRQKDLADIARLIEAEPRLREHLPDEIKITLKLDSDKSA